MLCEICGSNKARIIKTNKTFGKGKKLLLIENIPMSRCSNCGETYMNAKTLHELERLKLHSNNLAKKKSIATLNFK